LCIAPQTIFSANLFYMEDSMSRMYASQCLFDAVQALTPPSDNGLHPLRILLEWKTMNGVQMRFSVSAPILRISTVVNAAAVDSAVAHAPLQQSGLDVLVLPSSTMLLPEPGRDTVDTPQQVLDDLYATFGHGIDDDCDSTEEKAPTISQELLCKLAAIPVQTDTRERCDSTTSIAPAGLPREVVTLAPVDTPTMIWSRWCPAAPRRVFVPNVSAPLPTALRTPRIPQKSPRGATTRVTAQTAPLSFNAPPEAQTPYATEMVLPGVYLFACSGL
jgi:hypothetical protein